jgi:hypothetical protein
MADEGETLRAEDDDDLRSIASPARAPSLPGQRLRARSRARCCGAPSVVGRQRWARCALTALRLSYLFVFTAAAGAVYLLINMSADADTSVRVVGAIAVCLALPLSLFDVHAHLSAMVSPLQVRYVRILLMVPIYAFQSYLALFF